MKPPDARAIAGCGIYILCAVVLGMIFYRPDLAKDDLFKMLAQAIVSQGLIGLAMAHYFTSSQKKGPDE